MVRDGLVFKDENGQVIFNQYSFCELVKHLLVELVGISYECFLLGIHTVRKVCGGYQPATAGF